MSIGERIKIIRGKLSQDEFASRLSVSKAAIGAYERNVSIPGSTFIIAIREHFNIQFEWLLLGTGPMLLDQSAQAAALQSKTTETPPAGAEGVNLIARCAKLEEKLERMEEERRELSAENRCLSAENRMLLKENGDLRVYCASLAGPQHASAPDGAFSKVTNIPSSEACGSE